MRHAKVEIVRYKNKRDLYKIALMNAYEFWVDELDCTKSISRQRIDKSFLEVMDICLNDKQAHWTILFRDKVDGFDEAHWEFGVCGGSPSQFIWIKIRPDLADKIFLEGNLQVIEY